MCAVRFLDVAQSLHCGIWRYVQRLAGTQPILRYKLQCTTSEPQLRMMMDVCDHEGVGSDRDSQPLSNRSLPRSSAAARLDVFLGPAVGKCPAMSQEGEKVFGSST